MLLFNLINTNISLNELTTNKNLLERIVRENLLRQLNISSVTLYNRFVICFKDQFFIVDD